MIPKERLQKALEKSFGLASFRPGQLEIISSVTNGFDTLAVMPTGGGKSICYQLPAVLSDGLTIVVTPLVSLMKDQVAQINARYHGANKQIAAQLDSSLHLEEIRSRLRSAYSGDLKLLYVAPERLESKRFLEAMTRARISMLTVDEAHCISQWGHDFRPHYTRISDFAAAVGNPVVLALTATATPDVQDDILARLKMRSPRVYVRGFSRENLSFHVLVESPKTRSVLNYVAAHEGAGIIYAATRKSVDEIYELLKSNRIGVLRYHAGLTETERTRSQAEFLRSNRVMVATNAFGMGINKPDVRYVIHFEIPGTLESYYQEAGRGGRDGKFAECILLFHKKDIAVQEYFVNTVHPTREEFISVYTDLFDGLSIAVGSIREDYITISPQEVAGRTKLSSRTVDSVLRILSTNGLVRLMPSISASAQVRSIVDMPAYRHAIEKTASRDSRSVLEALLRLHGTALFSESRPVRIDELGRKAEIGPSNVSRTLSILQRSGIIEYKSPSEGITFLMLSRREDVGRLSIDFHQLARLRERATERLQKIVGYATATGCRANYILDYFGADEIDGGCRNCDNCNATSDYFSSESTDPSAPRTREIHLAILSLVKSTQGRYGRTTYCKILLGKAEGEATASAKQSWEPGRLRDTPAQVVYSAFDFLLEKKYMERKGFVYPTVTITEDGDSYLSSGIAPVMKQPYVLRKALYKALRDERRAIAADLHIPAFTVCTNRQLIEIANDHPIDDNGLAPHLTESGVNTAAIRKRILQVCRDFSTDLPSGLSETERKIYELFREKLTAAEIAAASSMAVQSVIETAERMKDRGVNLDLRDLIDRRRYALLEAELKKTRDVVKVHGDIGGCELAEVELVARLIGVSV